MQPGSDLQPDLPAQEHEEEYSEHVIGAEQEDGEEYSERVIGAEPEHGEECSEHVIDAEQAGKRLDRALADILGEGFSRSYLKGLIKDRHVLRGGKAAKPADKVQEGDLITIRLPERVLPDITPEDIPLDILYEDDDVLVVNKPKGMVVHPAAGHWNGTLVNAVMHHCLDPETGACSLSGINGVLRPGIVHRIDRDTTGSLIICKNDTSHAAIAAQLKEHSIRRKYLAIVCDRIREDELTIDRPIGRDPKDRKKMAVNSSGKPAVTHVRVLERFRNYTYVECVLETGRTHQIRVHMASMHHPVLGDEVYAGRRANPFASLTQGQCLHAAVLGFIHPATGEYIETCAPLPAYFEEILRRLRAEED